MPFLPQLVVTKSSPAVATSSAAVGLSSTSSWSSGESDGENPLINETKRPKIVKPSQPPPPVQTKAKGEQKQRPNCTFGKWLQILTSFPLSLRRPPWTSPSLPPCPPSSSHLPSPTLASSWTTPAAKRASWTLFFNLCVYESSSLPHTPVQCAHAHNRRIHGNF